jgi:hypothetical protein
MYEEIFKKLAMFEAPPAMLADISNFCMGAYASKILAILEAHTPFFDKDPKTQDDAKRLARYFYYFIQSENLEIRALKFVIDTNFYQFILAITHEVICSLGFI